MTWTKASTLGLICTNAPNGVMRVILPSTVSPFLKALTSPSHGSSLICLRLKAQTVLVDGDDLGLDGLADLDVVARVVDALPGDFTDVDQAFDTVDIDERTEVDDPCYDTFDLVTDLQLG